MTTTLCSEGDSVVQSATVKRGEASNGKGEAGRGGGRLLRRTVWRLN